MKYSNGRKAEQGDQIVNLKTGEAGPLENITPKQVHDGTIRLEHSRRDVALKDCVHLDDVRAAFATKPAKAETPAA